MTQYKDMGKAELGAMITKSLQFLRQSRGWTVDNLANYLELNSLTLRNMMARNSYGDLFVLIFKLKNVIEEELAYAYKAEIEKERIEKRKAKNEGME